MSIQTTMFQRDAIDYAKSKRTMTPEGYMIVKDCRVARTGIQHYMASEMGMLRDGQPDHVVGVYRPAEEVFDAESLASFEGKPITINHPDEWVTADNWKQYAGGHMSNVRRINNDMVADLTFTDAESIKAVNAGKAQLSNGYSHDIDWTAGRAADGGGYVAVQRKIRGNHVACVDQARAGPEYRVSDSEKARKELSTMTTDSAPKLVHIVHDGQTVAVNDAAALVIASLTKDRDTARADLAKAQDAATASATKIVELETQVKTLTENQITDAALADITSAIDQSKAISADTKIEGSNPDEIRRAAIKAVYDSRKAVIDSALCGTELEKASGVQLRTIAGLLAADTKAAPAAPANPGYQLPIATDHRTASPPANPAAPGAGRPMSVQDGFMRRLTGQK